MKPIFSLLVLALALAVSLAACQHPQNPYFSPYDPMPRAPLAAGPD
jgi:predicted small lipoprotein YifL